MEILIDIKLILVYGDSFVIPKHKTHESSIQVLGTLNHAKIKNKSKRVQIQADCIQN